METERNKFEKAAIQMPTVKEKPVNSLEPWEMEQSWTKKLTTRNRISELHKTQSNRLDGN